MKTQRIRHDRLVPVALGLSMLASAVTAPAQQPSHHTAAVRSLLPFAAPTLQYGDAGRTSALPPASHDSPDRGDAAPPAASFAPLFEWLRRRHGSAIDAGVLALRQGASKDEPAAAAVFTGEPAAVQGCVREFDALAATLHRPIELTAWRLPLPDGDLPACLWSPADVAHWLDAVPPTWTARAVTRTGGGVRLADERWISLVRDYDVEVAEKARISDPKLDLAFAGMRLGIRVHELPGDELLLEGEWLLSEPVALHEFRVGDGQPSIDEPEHRTAFVSFAGRVTSGGALAVSGRGGGTGPAAFLLVVRGRFLAPPVAPPGADVLALPVSGLLPRARIARAPEALWWPADDGRVRPDPDQTPQFGSETLLALMPEGTNAVVTGNALLVDGAGGGAIADHVTALFDEQTRNAALRCEVRGGAPLQLAMPAVQGRVAIAFVGLERTVVCDHEVEIAAKAATTNPVVTGVRSGLWSRARVSRDAVEGVWQVAEQGSLRERLHASEPQALLQLGDARVATRSWDGPMPADVEQDLGDVPAAQGDDGHRRLFVRVVR